MTEFSLLGEQILTKTARFEHK